MTTVCLTKFGGALIESFLQHEKFQSEPGSRVGTPAYLAPEVILTTRGKTYDGKVYPAQHFCLLQSSVCPALGIARSL